MNFQKLSYLPAASAPNFMLLDVPLEQKPLDFQVQYLTQVAALQQQMISLENDMQAASVIQDQQLQALSTQTLLAANDRIQSLEENLQNQEFTLNIENALLKKQIDQIQLVHQEIWTACLKTTAAKVENIAFKIKFVVQDLEAFKEKRKEKAEILAEWRKYKDLKEKSEKPEDFWKTPGYDDFVKRYLRLPLDYSIVTFPYINTQDLAICEAEYDAANFYSALIQKECLALIDNINWDGMAKHAAYLNTSTCQPLETIENNQEIQQLFEVLENDTLAKLKISNAALKVLADDMQAFHLAFLKELPLYIHNKYIKPCLHHIDTYIQGIPKIIQLYTTDLLPTQTEVEQIISSHFLNKYASIKLQLEQLRANIENDELVKLI